MQAVSSAFDISTQSRPHGLASRRRMRSTGARPTSTQELKMPPSKNRDGIATNVAAPAELKSRDAMLGDLLGKLARRAGSWGWLSTYECVRRGETVPAWHYR